MKVLPTQNADAARPRIADTRIDNADQFRVQDRARSGVDEPTPGTDVATDEPAAVSLRKGEKMEPVEDHKYAEITAGTRSGMFINTSGNVRDGEAFVLVRKNGKEYHIYGTGKDRLVVGFHMPATTTAPETDRAPAAPTPTRSRPTSRPRACTCARARRSSPSRATPTPRSSPAPRDGMFVNTSGNERHGETFVLVNKHGVEYHIYGSGANREVVAMKPRNRDDDR